MPVVLVSDVYGGKRSAVSTLLACVWAGARRQWRRIALQWCVLIMPAVLVSHVYGGKRSAVSSLLACVWAGARRQWLRIALQWCALIMPAVLVGDVYGGKRSAVSTLVWRYCFETLWRRGLLPRGAVLRVVKCVQP